MKTPRLALATAVLAGLSTAALADDLTVIYKTTSPSGAGTSTSYFSPTRMRMGNNDTDTIIEYGSGRIVTIDHAKKEYSEITLAEMDAALARMQQATAQAQQQLASLPPAMRERMEQMMGGGAAAVTLSKGGTRKVAGYDCQEWTISGGASFTQRVCASSAVVPPAVSVDYHRYSTLANSAAGLANNPMFKSIAKAAEEMKKIQGFHLANSTAMKMLGKSLETSQEATEVKKGPIPASAFDVATVAKGYKRVAHPMTKMK